MFCWRTFAQHSTSDQLFFNLLDFLNGLNDKMFRNSLLLTTKVLIFKLYRMVNRCPKTTESNLVTK